MLPQIFCAEAEKHKNGALRFMGLRLLEFFFNHLYCVGFRENIVRNSGKI